MKKIFAIAALVASASAFAQNPGDVYLGEPGYGGTGCPAGSVSATLSPDAKSLSILFDQFVTEAGREAGRTLDRKSCNVAIPVHVPQGWSVSVFSIDYRGYNFLPQGANSQFNVEYFFAGSRGPAFRQNFRGPLDRDYMITNDLIATAMVWSPCGADVNLRANTSLRVQTNSRREQAMATLDSADVTTALLYKLQWRRCN